MLTVESKYFICFLQIDPANRPPRFCSLTGCIGKNSPSSDYDDCTAATAAGLHNANRKLANARQLPPQSGNEVKGSGRHHLNDTQLIQRATVHYVSNSCGGRLIIEIGGSIIIVTKIWMQRLFAGNPIMKLLYFATFIFLSLLPGRWLFFFCIFGLPACTLVWLSFRIKWLLRLNIHSHYMAAVVAAVAIIRITTIQRPLLVPSASSHRQTTHLNPTCCRDKNAN